MNKNIDFLPVLLISVLFFCCSENKNQKKESSKPLADTLSEKRMTGNDVDENDCKASAGYRWSVIKNKCIRIFEDGIRLNPLEATTDKTTAAYLVFSGDNNKAELFLPTGNSSVILERKAEGQSWANGEWMLIPWKGYVLKKNNVAVYGGI